MTELSSTCLFLQAIEDSSPLPDLTQRKLRVRTYMQERSGATAAAAAATIKLNPPTITEYSWLAAAAPPER